jgi:hypothetical protein
MQITELTPVNQRAFEKVNPAIMHSEETLPQNKNHLV